MAEFKSGSALNAQLEEIINKAEEYLLLISPYIKLHSRIKSELKQKITDTPELEVFIVFGKAEEGGNKLSHEDAAFFKEFANIEIRYEKNLHAKYYANEQGGLITSMNLYDFSQNNNIECGVWMKAPISAVERLTGLSKDAKVDADAIGYFETVIDNSELLFKSEPEFESGFMGLGRKYKGSKITLDKLDAYVTAEGKKKESAFSGYKNFSENNSNKSVNSPVYKSNDYQHVNNAYDKNWDNNDSISPPKGYCIRTGVEIPFNPERPFCYDAYNTWSRFSNADYPEKYCHKTGRLSNGKTSFRKPIL